ncbi:hypothetical protein [Streptomyces sp. NPDC046925]|uniref:hypothetical protein n=1 Tax=Streptomyces sp. NPDC046925 TaxID=3155375 RepID=UPI0033D2667C
MQLDPRRGALCVIQATATTSAGATELAAYSMPAAPYGTWAWQLSVLAAYLSDPQTAKQGPCIASLEAHLHKRATAAIPSPGAAYPFTPWHDPRVSCLLDIVISPADASGWPRTSLILMEQESAPGTCAWMRVERESNTVAFLARALREMRAEQERLADRARTAPCPGITELVQLAGKVIEWLQPLHAAAHKQRQAARAAAVRSRIHPPASPSPARDGSPRWWLS